MVNIVPATPEHLKNLGPMRPRDASILPRPEISAVYGLETSCEAWAALIEDSCIAVWGVQLPQILDGGCIWLITTKWTDENKIKFLRESKKIICSFQKKYGSLYCFVEHDFLCSQKWLRWLGFYPTDSYISSSAKAIFRYDLRN